MNHEKMLKRLKAGEDPLELSIEKWRDIVEGKGKDLGSANCALCETFWCSGDCPVQLKTHQLLCSGTPYIKYRMAGPPEERLVFACEERAFLESLRPKKKA